MDGALCREHAITIRLELEGSPIERMVGAIDREIAKSRDPVVKAFGELLSGLFSQPPRPSQRPPSQQRRAPQPPRPSSPPPPDPRIVARQILGFELGDKLTKEQIQARKKALARVFHPDMPNGSEAQMKRVNDAADVLLANLS